MSMEHWTDRLSEYLDGELDATAAAALEAHVTDCAECGSALVELRQVVAAAAELPDREPATDLFPGILSRIREGDTVVAPIRPVARSARRFAFTVPQLAAAAAAIVTLSAGAVWLAMRPGSPPPMAAATQAVGTGPVMDPELSPDGQMTAAQFVSDTRASHEAVIGRLEQALDDQRDQLDPNTIDVIERNLAVIDSAIAEARAALENDPSNAYLYRHLDNTLNMKVTLLRRATRRATT
jgi:hypothetical protein